MTITTNTTGTTVINAESGMALRRKTDIGPTRITRVALAAWDSPDSWTDCEYAATEEESAAVEVPPPRMFSKLRIVTALTTAGVWDSVKQLLIDRGYYDLFLAAQVFSDDNNFFRRGKSALQVALGWTDAQVEELLSTAETTYS